MGVATLDPGVGDAVGLRLGAGVGITLPPLMVPGTATPLQ